ncbi:oxidoreductase [Pseudomonas oryzihabitans]|uniref:oxidoreductase n=1 Tax=Pseudomonas oryzihabitans TaxID=47885 RepID=UPI0015E29000|nr:MULTISPECIES: oxidoreductase [Pseudomonas]MBA1257797.1 oxidoreductase [Pseudomonas psychrotolerans]HJE67836.1 oxidoreductase [Pseudomonas oryzihabitans]
MPSPFRVALIGYGFVGQTFHGPLLSSIPGLSLDLVASRDAARVQADLPGVRVTADYLAAVRDPAIDLVVIASPNQTHAPLASAALAAGKHVVVDKPFTVTLAEARQLVEEAEQAGRLLSVFQNRRWDSDFLGLQAVLASGALGELTSLESRIERFRPEVRTRWREAALPGSGLWFDLGPHLLDQALCLFGLPERLQAQLVRQRPGALTDDWFQVQLDYGARQVTLRAGMLAAGGVPRFLAQGTAGSWIKQGADRQEDALKAGVRPGGPDWGQDPDPGWLIDASGERQALPTPAGDHRRYYLALVEALTGRADNPVSPAQACALMALLEAAQRSSAEGRALMPELSAAERAAY